MSSPKTAPGDVSPNTTTRWALAAGLLILVITAAVYVPAMQGGYIWDDDRYVRENPTLRTAGGLGRIWFEIGATPQYYPVVHSMFWAEYRLWGLNPFGFHLVNVLLHALGAVFAWRVLRHLELPGAWAAAAVFALHPVHVESVAWITERKNVLSGVFYLAAALAYLKYALPAPGRATRHERSIGLYFVSLVLFLLALGSKTVACSLPAALLLVLWWKRGKIEWSDVRSLAPFFVVGFGSGMLTAWMEKHHVGATGDDWNFSPIDRVLIAGRALWFYVGKLLVPRNLTFIYPRWQIDAGMAAQYLFPTAAAGVVGTLWALRSRLGRGPLIAVLFFCGTLLPALGFFDVYPMRYSFVADHFQYLASLGLIVLAVTLAARGFESAGPTGRKAGVVALSAVLLVLGTLTWRQSHAYAGLESLWRDTLGKNPAAWMAHNNLGIVLRSQKKFAEAREHYRQAVALRPHDAQIHYNLANTLAAEGQIEEALSPYLEAVRLDPEYADAHSNLGSAYQALRRLDPAIESFERSLEIEPGSFETRYNLAVALHGRGDLDRAIEQYERLLQGRPNTPQLHYTLAVALHGQGRREEAVARYREALRLNPSSPETHYAVSVALTESGRGDEALSHLQEAVRLKPDWPVSLNELAWILATHPDPVVRRGDEAVQLAEHAAELTEYGNPVILDTLAAGYAATGQFELAVSIAESALRLAAAEKGGDLADRIPIRLELYRREKAFVQPG